MFGRKNNLPQKEPIRPLKVPIYVEYAEYKRYRRKRFRRIFATALFSFTAIHICISLILGSEIRLVIKNGAESIFDGNAQSKEDTADKGGKDELYAAIIDIINGILIPDKNTQKEPQATQKESESKNIYDFDYSKVPNGETPIIPMDLSLSGYGNGYINNATSKAVNTSEMLNSDIDVFLPHQSIAQSAPLVLIVHTHATESYSENGAISYLDDGGELARSEDIAENVVAVGEVIAKELEENGIKTLHCTIMHDKLQYKDAYARAEETVKEYLKKYPSIKLVIDVHRDSIIKSTGELVRPVTEVDGKPAAQLMFVVGGSEACTAWQKNLTLALKLRAALNESYQNICRPPYLKSSTYNQDLAPYSILLEVGASGNSIEEAKLSALLFANELAKLFTRL